MKEYLIGATNSWVLKNQIPALNGCLVAYSCQLLQRNVEKRVKNTKDKPQLPAVKEELSLGAYGDSVDGSNHLTVSKSYKCDVCVKEFTSNKERTNIHFTETPHKCSECSKQFRNDTGQRNHGKLHTEETHRGYNEYGMCKENNDRQQSYRRSFPLYPSVLKPSGPSPVLIDNSQIQYDNYRNNSPTDGSGHFTPLCEPPARTTFGRPVHPGAFTYLTSHENIVNDLNSKKMEDKGYLCEVCGKVYTRKYGLKIHMRIHTGFKPLRCKYCPKTFGDPSNMGKHMRLHGMGDSRYKCQFCAKLLVRKRDLERHIKSRHPNGL